MPRYPSSSFAPSRYQTEAKESDDPARLAELATRKSDFVKSAVAANLNTSPATLDALASSESEWTRKAVAKNPNTTPISLRLLAGDSDASVKANVAYNTSTSTDILSVLAGDLSAQVRAGVAWNHHTPPETLLVLATDPDASVRKRVGKNPQTPEPALILLARDSNVEVRAATANRNFNKDGPTETVMRRRFNGRSTETYVVTRHLELGNRYPAEVIREFARSNDAKLQFKAAGQPDAPEDALMFLAQSTTVMFTLKIIAENLGASAAVLHAVVSRNDTDALKIVAVHPNADEETLTVLALSAARSVHAELAHKRPGGLAWLAAHRDPKVRLVAAKQFGAYLGDVEAGVAESVGVALLSDTDSAVQVAAAGSIPVGDMARFVTHTNPKVRKVIAERTQSSALLAHLSSDEKSLVRRAVARNVHAPSDALGRLAADTDAKVRQFAGERFLAALGA